MGGGAGGGAGERTVSGGGTKRLLALHLRAVLMTLAQKVQLCTLYTLHTLSTLYPHSVCALCAFFLHPPRTLPVLAQMLGFTVGWAWFDAFHAALDGTMAPWGFACVTTACSSLWSAP